MTEERKKFRAGDIVHRYSSNGNFLETVILAADEENEKVYFCCSRVDSTSVNNCILHSAASDKERLEILRVMAGHPYFEISNLAKCQLAGIAAAS